MNFPTEIINKINEYCCIKKHNNINSRDFIIDLKYSIIINNIIKNDIISWLEKILQQIIIELKNTQIYFIYELYDNNTLRVLCSFNISDNLLSPNIILKKLNNEHKYINQIIVNGISDVLMSDLWFDIRIKSKQYNIKILKI